MAVDSLYLLCYCHVVQEVEKHDSSSDLGCSLGSSHSAACQAVPRDKFAVWAIRQAIVGGGTYSDTRFL